MNSIVADKHLTVYIATNPLEKEMAMALRYDVFNMELLISLCYLIKKRFRVNMEATIKSKCYLIKRQGICFIHEKFCKIIKLESTNL